MSLESPEMQRLLQEEVIFGVQSKIGSRETIRNAQEYVEKQKSLTNVQLVKDRDEFMREYERRVKMKRKNILANETERQNFNTAFKQHTKEKHKMRGEGFLDAILTLFRDLRLEEFERMFAY